MTKLTIDDLVGDMPAQKIVEALDDDGDLIADEAAFRAVLASANERAAAIFGGKIMPQYAAAVDHAVRIFVLDLLYRRRAAADEANPWSRLADEEAARLRSLASGTESIDASGDGVVISKPARIYNSTGVLS